MEVKMEIFDRGRNHFFKARMLLGNEFNDRSTDVIKTPKREKYEKYQRYREHENCRSGLYGVYRIDC